MIRNERYMSQVVDFEGMQYGKCRPTDIDLSMDWQGKVFLFVELKYAGTGLTLGQRLHLSHLCNAIVAGGRQAYAILAEHETPSHERIIAAKAYPVLVYHGDKKLWATPMEDTLHELLDNLHKETRV